MFIIFALGMLCSSMLERRAEVASVFNNRRVVMTDSIVSQNEKVLLKISRGNTKLGR